jgi:hypothetical protein
MGRVFRGVSTPLFIDSKNSSDLRFRDGFAADSPSNVRRRRVSGTGPFLRRGTEGSNPAPSSGESAANLTSSIEREAEVTIRWLWTEERVSRKGRFYAVNDAGIGVKERGIAIRLEPYRPAWCRAVH